MHLASRIAHLRLEKQSSGSGGNSISISAARSRSRSHSPIFRPPTDSDDPDNSMVQPRSTRSTVRRRPNATTPAPQWQRVACRMMVAIFGISIALYISNLESEAIGKATETSVEQHHKHDHEEFVDDNAQGNQAPGVSGADSIKAGAPGAGAGPVPGGDFDSQKKELYRKPGQDLLDKRKEMLSKHLERKEQRKSGLQHDHSIHGVNQPPEIAGMMMNNNLRGNDPVSGDESNPVSDEDDDDDDDDTDDRRDDDDNTTPASASDEDEDEEDGPDSDEDEDEDRTPKSGDDDDDDDDSATEDLPTDGDESKADDRAEDDVDDDVVHTEDSPSKKDEDPIDEEDDDQVRPSKKEGEDVDVDDDVVRSDDSDAVKRKKEGNAAVVPLQPKTKVKVRLDREEDDEGEDEDAGDDTGDIVDTEASPSRKDLEGSEDDEDGEEKDSGDDDEGEEGVVEQGPPVTYSSGDDKKKKKKGSTAVDGDDDDEDDDGEYKRKKYPKIEKADEKKKEKKTSNANEGDDSGGGDDATTEDGEKPKVGKIALLGERNTGTRWMSAQLEQCFPSLKVSPRLLRWKHWFQEDDGLKHDKTLVISQFRNVYEWTEAMRVVPHHAPLHVKLDWKEFVTKPWTMKRPKRDLPFKDSEKQVCFEKFKYNQLISCIEGSRNDTSYLEYNCDPDKHYSCHKPIYELKQDGSGEPYENILDMRADKIRNFVLDIKKWNWIADVIPVQYETLLSNGTDFLISRVEEITGVKRKCKAVGAQVRKKRVLDPEMIEWLNDHVDWEAEKLVDYKKWDKTDTAEKNDEIDKGEGEGDSLATEMSESADEKDEGKKSAKLTEEGKDANGKKLKGDVKGEDANGGGNGGDSIATDVNASADEKEEGEAGNKDLDVKDEKMSEEKVASKKRKYT